MHIFICFLIRLHKQKQQLRVFLSQQLLFFLPTLSHSHQTHTLALTHTQPLTCSLTLSRSLTFSRTQLSASSRSLPFTPVRAVPERDNPSTKKKKFRAKRRWAKCKRKRKTHRAQKQQQQQRNIRNKHKKRRRNQFEVRLRPRRTLIG